MNTVFSQWIGMVHSHRWQIAHSMNLSNGKDVFITVKTGSGKSVLTLAPVIARKLLKRPHAALVIYPTEVLMKDQVSQHTLAEKSKLRLLSKEERARQKGSVKGSRGRCLVCYWNRPRDDSDTSYE